MVSLSFFNSLYLESYVGFFVCRHCKKTRAVVCCPTLFLSVERVDPGSSTWHLRHHKVKARNILIRHLNQCPQSQQKPSNRQLQPMILFTTHGVVKAPKILVLLGDLQEEEVRYPPKELRHRQYLRGHREEVQSHKTKSFITSCFWRITRKQRYHWKDLV